MTVNYFITEIMRRFLAQSSTSHRNAASAFLCAGPHYVLHPFICASVCSIFLKIETSRRHEPGHDSKLEI